MIKSKETTMDDPYDYDDVTDGPDPDPEPEEPRRTTVWEILVKDSRGEVVSKWLTTDDPGPCTLEVNPR